MIDELYNRYKKSCEDNPTPSFVTYIRSHFKGVHDNIYEHFQATCEEHRIDISDNDFISKHANNFPAFFNELQEKEESFQVKVLSALDISWGMYSWDHLDASFYEFLGHTFEDTEDTSVVQEFIEVLLLADSGLKSAKRPKYTGFIQECRVRIDKEVDRDKEKFFKLIEKKGLLKIRLAGHLIDSHKEKVRQAITAAESELKKLKEDSLIEKLYKCSLFYRSIKDWDKKLALFEYIGELRKYKRGKMYPQDPGDVDSDLSDSECEL